MLKYIVDANVPYYFYLWDNEAYVHVLDIDAKMKDSEIWAYAKEHKLTIVTKDTDFSNMVMLHTPPPRVIHIKLGNMKIKAFYKAIVDIWDDVLLMSGEYKLVRVYKNKLEGIG